MSAVKRPGERGGAPRVPLKKVVGPAPPGMHAS